MRGNWDGHEYSAGPRVGAAGSADIQLNTERVAVSESKLAKWRHEHPDAFGTWETKYGCVIAFGGMKVYYGRCPNVIVHDGSCLVPHGGRKQSCTCPPCGRLVTARRPDPPRAVVRGSKGGRWPMYCVECREAKNQSAANQNRRYAANYRRGLYERRGSPPRQGVPGPATAEARLRRYEEAEEHFELYHFDGEGECYEANCRYNTGEDCNA